MNYKCVSLIHLDDLSYYTDQTIELNDINTFSIQGDENYIRKQLLKLKKFTMAYIGEHPGSIKIVISESMELSTPEKAVVDGFADIISGQMIGTLSVIADLSLNVVSNMTVPSGPESDLMSIRKVDAFDIAYSSIKKHFNSEKKYRIKFMRHTPERESQASVVIDTGVSAFTFGHCPVLIRQASMTKSSKKKLIENSKYQKKLVRLNQIDRVLMQHKIMGNVRNHHYDRDLQRSQQEKKTIIDSSPRIQLKIIGEEMRQIKQDLQKKVSGDALLNARLRSKLEQRQEIAFKHGNDLIEGIEGDISRLMQEKSRLEKNGCICDWIEQQRQQLFDQKIMILDDIKKYHLASFDKVSERFNEELTHLNTQLMPFITDGSDPALIEKIGITEEALALLEAKRRETMLLCINRIANEVAQEISYLSSTPSMLYTMNKAAGVNNSPGTDKMMARLETLESQQAELLQFIEKLQDKCQLQTPSSLISSRFFKPSSDINTSTNIESKECLPAKPYA